MGRFQWSSRETVSMGNAGGTRSREIQLLLKEHVSWRCEGTVERGSTMLPSFYEGSASRDEDS